MSLGLKISHLTISLLDKYDERLVILGQLAVFKLFCVYSGFVFLTLEYNVKPMGGEEWMTSIGWTFIVVTLSRMSHNRDSLSV